MQNVDWRPPYAPKARVRAHYPSKCGLAPHPPYTPRARVRAHGAQGPWAAGGRRDRSFFGIIICLSGQGVAEDSAVSTLAVKQNGAILNDSLLVGPLRVESYPKVTPPPPLYPNMRIN